MVTEATFWLSDADSLTDAVSSETNDGFSLMSSTVTVRPRSKIFRM